mgnify:CR=1 FL=1
MSLPRILMVSLGGTITMTPSKAGGIAPTLTAEDLLAAVPEMEQVAVLDAASPLALPSASLTVDEVADLARTIDARLRDDVDGVVVIQGTDTIEETAFLLELLVESGKPVVVTGAMRGPQTPGADGPANLLAAVTVAASVDAHGLGVLVVLNDEIHAARFVQKSHTTLPSAFTSPSLGPLGLVIERRAIFRVRVQRSPALRHGAWTDRPTPVALVKMALGEDGRLLRALPELGYQGLVLEGMGAGHVPAELAPIIGELIAKMPVVLCSRAHTGPSLRATYGYDGSEIDLLRRGAISGGDLSGLKARLLLMALLRQSARPDAIKEAFRTYSTY